MNILPFLTPKNQVEFLCGDMTIRQALEKMGQRKYSEIPVLDKETGRYLYSLGEGDFLWFLKDNRLDFDELERRPISQIKPTRTIATVGVSSEIEDLYGVILAQNYVPVVDDRGLFIGIVTRKTILSKFLQNGLKGESY